MIGCLAGTTECSPQSFQLSNYRQGRLSQLVRVLFAFSGSGDVWMATSADWRISYQMIHQIRLAAESVGLAADYRTVRSQSKHLVQVWGIVPNSIIHVVYLSVEHGWITCITALSDNLSYIQFQ